jgi:hypothetical protein
MKAAVVELAEGAMFVGGMALFCAAAPLMLAWGMGVAALAAVESYRAKR